MQRENRPRDNSAFLREARSQLARDAERAKDGEDGLRREWIDPALWSQYTGKAANSLYRSFTDEELLNMLRTAAAELGRRPTQREIFCVYRIYIRRRFKNWPQAMLAAGLGKPKSTESEE